MVKYTIEVTKFGIKRTFRINDTEFSDFCTKKGVGAYGWNTDLVSDQLEGAGFAEEDLLEALDANNLIDIYDYILTCM